MGVNRSGYYKWLKRGKNQYEYKCQSKNVQICSLKNVQFYN